MMSENPFPNGPLAGDVPPSSPSPATAETDQGQTSLAKRGWAELTTLDQDGIHFPSMAEVWGLAGIIATARMCPNGDTRESLAIKIAMGQELGLSAWAAIRGIAVINGQPSLWGDVMLGICQRAAVFDHTKFREWIENDTHLANGAFSDDCTAHCTVARKGCDPIEATFSVADAKQAGLWARESKGGKPMPWSQYPLRMLKQRARAFALRDTFADVLQGLYSCEELEGPTVEVEALIVDAPKQSRTAALRESLTMRTEPTPEPESELETIDEPDPQPEPDPTSEPTADDVDIATIRERLCGRINATPSRELALALGRAKVDDVAEIVQCKDGARLLEIEKKMFG